MGSFYYCNNDWEEILVSIDSNGDGRVDFSEFISAAYTRSKLVSEKNLEIAFKMFDIDGNG